MPVTIREIARKVGMSPSTVSQALSGKGKLRWETRMRVRAAARELGYYLADDPFGINPVISGRPIRIVFGGQQRAPEASKLGAFASRVLDGVQSVLRPYRTHLVWGSDADAGVVLPGLIGTLVIGGAVSNALVQAIEATHLPAVTVGCHVDSCSTLGAVEADAIEGIRLSVAYLYELGHRRIALLNGSQSTRTSDQKLTGFLRACHDYGLPACYIASVDPPWSFDHALPLARSLLSSAWTGVTAVIAAYESLGAAVLEACRELGRSVPGDLSVIAYHDEELAGSTTPKLTAVSLPLYQMGRLAATHLVAASENTDLVGVRIVLPPRLSVRESTGPAPAQFG